MKLERFRISNFRSVKDSGWIDVGDVTAFVGRNESGKTNLLNALASLNDGITPRELSRTQDFPADRLHSDFSSELDVVKTTWRLDAEDRDALAQMLPEARDVEQVEVGRGYLQERWVNFVGLEQPDSPAERASEMLKRVVAVPTLPGAPMESDWVRAHADLAQAVEHRCDDPRAWAIEVGNAMVGLQAPLQSGRTELGDDAREALEEIADLSTQVVNESGFENAARDWVLRRMPRFLYLDEYPDIEGNQDLRQFAERQRQNRPHPADRYFSMLLQVSGIDPDGVMELLDEDPEMRRQIASRAGAVLTRTLRQIWSDRPLKVRFNLDGDYFNTLVSDPTSLCDIEVNLNQRSRGFRSFFSFYVMFASGQKDGSTSQALLLLDEPGLHLHSIGQQDLLQHLTEGMANQVVFATQSPFMVPEGDQAKLHTIVSSEETGTVVSAAERGSLFPELAAVPVEEGDAVALEVEPEEIDDGLDELDDVEDVLEAPVGPVHPTPILMLPEISDYWFLMTASDYLSQLGRVSFPKEIALTPAGGTAAIPAVRNVLGGTDARMIFLSSELPEGDEAGTRSPVVWVGEALTVPPNSAVDLEDLLDPELYDRFVRFAYRQELEGYDLEIDLRIPRIVERYEAAFLPLGIEFQRTRPARLILKGAFKSPETLISDQAVERFERLIDVILDRFTALYD